MARHVLALMMIILMSGAATAEAPPAFQAVREAYAQARDGLLEPDKAADVIEGFLKAHPAHPVATAYLGSVKTMIARDAFFPFTKLTKVNQGLELLDDAVEHLDQAEVTAGHDGRLDILMVSGLTNAAVPSALGRRRMAERDLAQARKLPAFEAVPAGTKAKVYAWLAVFAAARDASEADALLTLARAEDTAIADALWTEER